MEFKEALEAALLNVEPTVSPTVAKELRKFFFENSELFEKNLPNLMPSDDQLRKAIEEHLKSKNLSHEDYLRHKEHIEKILIEGKTQAEALELDKSILDGLYSLGYHHYNQGKYKQANTFFCYLTLLDSKDPRYFYAAGACFHMLKEYEAALGFYDICSKLDWVNPLPWYHIGDCAFEMGNYALCVFALENMLYRTQNLKKYEKIEEKAKLFLETATQKLNEAVAKFFNEEES